MSPAMMLICFGIWLACVLVTLAFFYGAGRSKDGSGEE